MQNKGLAHVAIMCVEIKESIAFYQKLGAELKAEDAIGDKKLALLEWCGFTIELVQPAVPTVMRVGNIPHLAIYVDDIDAAAAEVRAAGIDTFVTPEKNVLPKTFGGLQNWFFKGPADEEIELLQML